jgi:7-cyano-7-deazaguanine synthase
LAWALERFKHVETLGFDYGQRHSVELKCRTDVLSGLRNAFPKWRSKLGTDQVLKLDVLREISETALTRNVEIALGKDGLPTSFVPGRNILFMTVAAAIAYHRGIKVLVGGMCETDYSGYPDCRDDTMKALQATLGLGMATRFVIETPLMWIDKAQTWKLAKTLGGDELVKLILEKTHTCYRGAREERHSWGYGCGDCPACELRSKGYFTFLESDMLSSAKS